MRISHTKHVTNDEVVTTVVQSMKLLAQVKSRKLKYFGHVTRHNRLCLVLFPENNDKVQGQKKQWLDAITEWSGRSGVV